MERVKATKLGETRRCQTQLEQRPRLKDTRRMGLEDLKRAWPEARVRRDGRMFPYAPTLLMEIARMDSTATSRILLYALHLKEENARPTRTVKCFTQQTTKPRLELPPLARRIRRKVKEKERPRWCMKATMNPTAKQMSPSHSMGMYG